MKYIKKIIISLLSIVTVLFFEMNYVYAASSPKVPITYFIGEMEDIVAYSWRDNCDLLRAYNIKVYMTPISSDYYPGTNRDYYYENRVEIDYDTYEQLKYDSNYYFFFAYGDSYKKQLFQHFITQGCLENRIVNSNNTEVEGMIKLYQKAIQLTDDSMTDREKVIAIHDWLKNEWTASDIGKGTYNNGFSRASVISQYDLLYGSTFPSYQNLTCAINQCGDAQAFSICFDLMMYVLGIECESVVSRSNVSYNGVSTSTYNRVYLDGQWYYIDNTLDSYFKTDEYLLLSKEQMQQYHSPWYDNGEEYTMSWYFDTSDFLVHMIDEEDGLTSSIRW